MQAHALIFALLAGVTFTTPAPAQSVLKTAAELFAGSAVKAGSDTEGAFTYKPSIADMVTALNDSSLTELSASMQARGIAIEITSELTQPEHCLFEIKTSLVAPGVFAGTLSTSIDLQNAKGVSTRKRPDGTLEGVILGDASFTCYRFSITARNAPFDPGRAKCDTVNLTAPIDRAAWMAAAQDMSSKYCPLGKIE